MVSKVVDKNLRHNYIVNLLDGGFFGMAMGFASFSGIIPLFMMTMTDSAILIGIIPAIHSMGWQFPQLFMAKKTSRLALYKPFVVMITIHERLPFLGLAVVAYLVPQIGKEAAVLLTLVMLIWQGVGGGLGGNGWQNMIAKIIPSRYLATFFGIQSSAMSLVASIGSVAAGAILAVSRGTTGFVICFGIAGLATLVSLAFLNMTREQERLLPPALEKPPTLIALTQNAFSGNNAYGWYLVSRVLSQFGIMGIAFYIVYAVRFFQMSEATVGVMTGILMFSQVIANPLFGWLSDHWNRKNVLIIGTGCAFLSALLMAVVQQFAWFYLIFILAGCAYTANWVIAMAFTMDFGQEEDRPLFVGMTNTVIAPATILAPIIGGWVADQFGFHFTFLIAACSSLGAILILAFLVPQKNTTLENHA